MYVAVFVTILAKATSSPLHIQSWLSQTHPMKGDSIERCLHLRDTYILRIRGGNDRGYDYNYGDGDYAAQRSPYEDDYYGKKDERDLSYDDRYQERSYDYNREEYDNYNDDYKKKKKKPRKGSTSVKYLPDVIRTGNKKIGFALLGSGFIFTILGVTLFFNKTLMRLGNLLFIAGIPMTIGPTRTMGYFLQPKKARATGCLAFGIFLVMVGWPIFGIILEIFGIMNLFGNMFPILKILLKQVPVVGGIFDNGSTNKKSRKPQKKYYEDEDYYAGRENSRRERDRYEEENSYEERYSY